MLIAVQPESPRWLFAHGRQEEARAFLVRFHGAGDANSPYIALQWKEFNDGIKLNGSDQRWWDFRTLLSTKNARWRCKYFIYPVLDFAYVKQS